MGERLGSGDGERKTLLTRQMPYEPLPASVLFGLGWFVMAAHHGGLGLVVGHSVVIQLISSPVKSGVSMLVTAPDASTTDQ